MDDGEKLRNYLNINKLKRQEIAEKLGVSRNTFQQYLKQSEIKTSIVEKLIDIFGEDFRKLGDYVGPINDLNVLSEQIEDYKKRLDHSQSINIKLTELLDKAINK